MERDYQESPSMDPLGYREALPLEVRLFPLGFPLTLKTNSPEVVAAGREGMGEFEAAFDTAPIELRVAVEGDAAEPVWMSPEGPAFRAQGHLLALVLGPGNFVMCDLERGLGFGRLSPGVARNHLYAGFHFLECAAYVCLCQRYLTPIHAACVARGGRGALLVGGPGAGKSSLAWACARAGLTFVSDDATWLLRDGVRPADGVQADGPTLIGRPQRMRFRPETVQLIPELAQARRLETVIGKHSFEIRTAETPGFTTARRCRPGPVIFLERNENGAAEVRAVGADETRRRLAEASSLYEPRVWREQEASREQLARDGGLALRYSSLGGAAEQILKLL